MNDEPTGWEMSEDQSKYVEALGAQKLRAIAAKKGYATYQDVADVFWIVCADLERAIINQRPEKLEEARRDVLEKVAPRLAVAFERDFGIRILPREGNA